MIKKRTQIVEKMKEYKTKKKFVLDVASIVAFVYIYAFFFVGGTWNPRIFDALLVVLFILLIPLSINSVFHAHWTSLLREENIKEKKDEEIKERVKKEETLRKRIQIDPDEAFKRYGIKPKENTNKRKAEKKILEFPKK